jgi:hypothetical protein
MKSVKVAGMSGTIGRGKSVGMMGIQASPWIVGRAWIGMLVLVGFQLTVASGVNQMGSMEMQRRYPIVCVIYITPSW